MPWMGKVVLLRHSSDSSINSEEKFIPLRMPEGMNTTECVMTVEYCWVKSDAIQELLWVFPPDSAKALLVQGMTNGLVIRYRLDPIGYGIEEIPELTCLAFPSMYSE
eukprot:scaffold7138_cov69-Attheya_sp.AAC.2